MLLQVITLSRIAGPAIATLIHLLFFRPRPNASVRSCLKQNQRQANCPLVYEHVEKQLG